MDEKPESTSCLTSPRGIRIALRMMDMCLYIHFCYLPRGIRIALRMMDMCLYIHFCYLFSGLFLTSLKLNEVGWFVFPADCKLLERRHYLISYSVSTKQNFDNSTSTLPSRLCVCICIYMYTYIYSYIFYVYI